ncbi:MAG TPA: class I SAM-dependent methyltransferase [Thermoanaerobaculia bacterium]
MKGLRNDMAVQDPEYLRPYYEARQRKVRGVHALLWNSEETQQIRFEAIARNCPLAGLSLLDVGCGRADLLGFLRQRGIVPSRYTGIEAVTSSIRAARRRKYEGLHLIKADFVKQPETLDIGADVVIFSGSLSTLPEDQFYETLERAWASAERALAFNFLCTPRSPGDADWIVLHHPATVAAFARSLAADVRIDNGYMDDDCTIVMRKR